MKKAAKRIEVCREPKPVALNPLTEMMTKIVFNPSLSNERTLRVWSIAKAGQCGPDKRILKALGSYRYPSNVAAHVRPLMDARGHKVVAAYELLDKNGQGFVHYPDWK